MSLRLLRRTNNTLLQKPDRLRSTGPQPIASIGSAGNPGAMPQGTSFIAHSNGELMPVPEGGGGPVSGRER